MMKHISYRFFCLIVTIVFVAVSCSDDDSPSRKVETEAVSTIAQTVKIQNSVNSAAISSKENLAGFSFVKSFQQDSCPSIKFIFDETNQAPDTLILDFGQDSCEWYAGQYFSGKIIMVLDTAMMSGIQIIFDNFCTQDICMDGEYSMDFGEDDFSLGIEDELFMDENGMEYTYTADFDYSMVSGQDTEDISDDVYLISGSASGTTPDGEAFTMTITTPLRLDMSCEYATVTEGIAVYQMEGQDEITVDYGDGSCDNLVKITIGDETQEVEI